MPHDYANRQKASSHFYFILYYFPSEFSLLFRDHRSWPLCSLRANRSGAFCPPLDTLLILINPFLRKVQRGGKGTVKNFGGSEFVDITTSTCRKLTQ